MTQKGTHTWDLIVQYHRCPKCSRIFESREDYQYRLGRYEKDLECPNCHYMYTLTKEKRPSFGPLIGEPQPKEIEWG